MTHCKGLPHGSSKSASALDTKVLRLVAIAMLFAGIALSGQQANAATVTVDGNLADLITASGEPVNGASGSEAGNDAEQNGFDITNMYSYFDYDGDAFYLGFATDAVIGDACAGPLTCWFDSGGLAFDGDETLGFQMKFGDTDFGAAGAVIVQTILLGDGILNNGPGNETATGSIAPGGVTVSWAVSEADDGVEFAISGLLSSSEIAPTGISPVDFAVRFTAGSADNQGQEDEAFLSGTVVPVPAAAWLFGSALVGLAGLRRRRS